MMNTEYIYGALYGHAYGDASGAILEFLGHLPTQKEIQDAMDLKGGGALGVAPGQVTDDTELSVQLFKALYNYENKDENDMRNIEDFISEKYIEWVNSEPFDIGITTQNAFLGSKNAFEMRKRAEKLNSESESNGALMRCIPLAVYSYNHKLTPSKIYDLIEKDVYLTHSKKTVVNFVFMYVSILIYLFKNDGKIDDDFKDKIFNISLKLKDERLINIVQNFNKPRNCAKLIGWDAHAFSLTLYCLMNNLNFEDGIKYTLSKGGDTDTNAAIVGGILGARYGINSVPLVDKIVKCKPNYNRNEFHPKIYLKLLVV